MTTSVEGFVGYYRPFGHFEPASVYSVFLPTEPSDLEGPAWGGTIHVGFGRLGVAAQLATARSQVGGGITPAGPRAPVDARVVLGSVLGQFDLSPDPRAYHVWLNAGPAFVRHEGDAYRPFGSPTSVGPALGAAARIPLWTNLQLTAEATGVFYTFDLPMPAELQLNPGPLEHGARKDLLVHLGIAWTPW